MAATRAAGTQRLPFLRRLFVFFPLILELAGCRGGCTRAVGRPSQGADIKHHHLLFIGALLESFSAKAAPHTLKCTGCLF